MVLAGPGTDKVAGRGAGSVGGRVSGARVR